MKATTLLTFAPLGARYLDSPAGFVLGLLPSAWPVYTTWLATDGGGLVGVTAVGLVVTSVWLALAAAVLRHRVRGRGY